MTEAEQLVHDLRTAAKEPCDGCCYGESMVKAADEIERLRAALRQCADLLVLGDERGNPNETELEAHKTAYELLRIRPT